MNFDAANWNCRSKDNDETGFLSVKQKSPNLKYKQGTLVILEDLECRKKCIVKIAEQKYPQRINIALHAVRRNKLLPNHNSNLTQHPNHKHSPNRKLTRNNEQACLIKTSIP